MTQPKRQTAPAKAPRRSRVQRDKRPSTQPASPLGIPDVSDPAFLAFAEVCPSIVLIISRTGRILFANSNSQTITGYRKEDMCAPDFGFMGIIAPECRAPARQYFRRFRIPPHETCLLTQDGQLIRVSITLQPVVFRGSKAVLGIMTDITSRQHLENLLRAERDRLQSYLDAMPIFAVVLDTHATIVQVNHMAAKKLGYRKVDLIGKNWFDACVPRDGRAQRRAYYNLVMAGKKPIQTLQERPIVTRQGASKTLLWFYTAIHDEKGKMAGSITCGFDVGEKMRMRDHLRESQEKYRGLFENSPIGIYRTTPDGRILMANPAIVKMMGYSSFEELAKINVAKQSYTPDSPRTRFIKAIETKGSVKGFEAKWTRKDGTILHVRENADAIRDSDGKTLYYEGTIEDVSEQKNAREVLDRQLEFERLLTGLSMRFVNLAPNELDEGIHDALKQLGEFMGVDRGYVFQYRDNHEAMDNTHEWVRKGIGPHIDRLQNLSIADFGWINSRILNEETVTIPRVKDLPKEAAVEKKEFETESIQSLVLVPLVCGGRVRGFLGFDAVRNERTWTDTSISLLKIAGEILANALEQQKAEHAFELRIALGSVIASLSTKLVGLAPRELDEALHAALTDIKDLLGAAHVSIFQILESKGGTQLATLWSTRGATPLPPGVSTVSLPGVPSLIGRLQRLEIVEVRTINDVSRQDTFMRNIMKHHQIGAMLLTPFRYDKKTVGYLAFAFKDTRAPWSKDTLSLFKIIGEILANVFELKAALRSLESERHLFTALMDSIPDRIYFKDEKSRFITANRAMYTGHGLPTLKNLVGKTDFDLFADDHAQRALEDEQAIIQTGKPMIGKEEKEVWPDGKITWASSTKLPLYDEKGHIVGTFGVSRDITERKQAEEERLKLEAQMQHAQKLESLGVLSGGIAHDFNNLLMGILGNTGLALMQLTPESPVWGNIKQIETVALRAAELTNQMLAYSGKSKFIVEPLDITSLVREMAHLLEVSITKKIRLDYVFPAKLPPVDGDASQIRQVVMNLITNASDAIGNRKGRIAVATGIMDCTSSYFSSCYIAENLPPGRYIFVEVTDSGCGMDAKTQQRIFDPFFTTKVKGRGLGLAAVLGIVRSHKGTLKVYSELGKGTNFKVLFPCSSTSTEAARASSVEKSEWRGSGTVLVVDDDEVIRIVTKQILERVGFSVVTAAEGRSALKQCRQEADRLAAILLDITLPETSANELLEELRQIVSATPIILFSGYNETTATADMKPGSFHGFIQKPFTPDALARVFRDTLSKG